MAHVVRIYNDEFSPAPLRLDLSWELLLPDETRRSDSGVCRLSAAGIAVLQGGEDVNDRAFTFKYGELQLAKCDNSRNIQ